MKGAHVLSFAGTRAGFVRAFADLRRALDARELQPRARYNCELVFEEVVTNIIKHGYTDDREHRIEVSLDFPERSIVLRFYDDAVPFDPLQYAPSSQPPTSIRDIPVGGRGLTLLRKAAEHLHYERTPDHRNRLTVTIAAHA
jgi:anti-sigma regulatory factor (Ser/Thr protein kinase)